MGLMQSLLRKDRQASATAPGAPEAASPGTAPLIMLAPDAQGIATYRLHEFPSAKAAEIFVDVTLRGQVNERTVIFWALNGQPGPDIYAEPLVLIRDAASPVVYLFSFADLNSCHDFIRHEMTRGLDLRQVMVYWAVPAAVDRDIWGRAVVTPGSPPRSAQTSELAATEIVPESRKSMAESPPPSVLPFVSRQESPETARYLTESDIAETVREMNEFTARFDAAKPDVIDFPAASRKIRRTKKAARAMAGWDNFARALDEALDVYVSEQVRVRIALSRIVRALAQAGFLHSATSAKDPVTEPPRKDAIDVSRAWASASIAVADAATIAIRRALMRRVWMNTAWTLEEAAYAYRLETRSRASRGWRFASEALAEAAKTRYERDAAVALAWSVMSSELVSAAEAQVATEGTRRAWTCAAKALRQAASSAKRRRKVMVTAWVRLARAMKQAVAAQEKARKARERAEAAAAKRAEKAAARAERQAAKAAGRAAGAARTADKRASATLEATPAVNVESPDEEELSEEEQISRWLARQETGHTRETGSAKPKRSRWEPHEEPFKGFRSPPGRF
jgi:hypothetical protein